MRPLGEHLYFEKYILPYLGRNLKTLANHFQHQNLQ